MPGHNSTRWSSRLFAAFRWTIGSFCWTGRFRAGSRSNRIQSIVSELVFATPRNAAGSLNVAKNDDLDAALGFVEKCFYLFRDAAFGKRTLYLGTLALKARDNNARKSSSKIRHESFAVVFLFVGRRDDDERPKSEIEILLDRNAFRDDPLKIVVLDRRKPDAIRTPFKLSRRREMTEQIIYLSRDLLIRRSIRGIPLGLEGKQSLVDQRLKYQLQIVL